MATNSSGATPPETFDYEEYQHHLDLVRTYGPTALFMDRVIRKVSAPFKGLDVLDLGCGTGHLSRMLERDNRVVSYDPAFEGVRTTRERRRTRGVFVVGGGEHLPFRDESFDAILLIDVLEHIADDAGVAREATPRAAGRAAACSAWCRRTRRSTRGPTRRTATCGATTRTSCCGSSPPAPPRRSSTTASPSCACTSTCWGASTTPWCRRRGPRVSSAPACARPPAALTGLFSLDLLFAGWFRGVEIVAVFRKPGASAR